MQLKRSLNQLLDSDVVSHEMPGDCNELRALKSEPDRWIPFVFLHSGCLLVFATGWSPVAVGVAAVLYAVRMFAITAFYHRYFSHRTFKTSRPAQFIFALLGLMAVQRGPLWWAAHHRVHHRKSDQQGDVHSPIVSSFLWSHIGWITASPNMATKYNEVSDFDSYPELRWLNRFDWLMPAVLVVALFAAGELLAHWQPSLHTSGLQLVAWGFFVSTTVLFHATSSINSFSHLFGTRRFDTPDNSRNNWLLALITFGEGWHNNHHRFSHSVRQGFYWWELDISYLLLKGMSALGIIWDLKPVPSSVYSSAVSEADGQVRS